MRATFVIAILLSVLLTIFALANNSLMEINYLFGTVEVPKALVIMLSLAFGVLIMFLFNIPSWWKHRKEKSALKKEITTLRAELAKAPAVRQEPVQPLIENHDEFTTDVEKE